MEIHSNVYLPKALKHLEGVWIWSSDLMQILLVIKLPSNYLNISWEYYIVHLCASLDK